MSTTDEHLARIRSKLQQVLKQQALLQKENQQLKEEVDRLTQERTDIDQQLEELQQKAEILKYSHGEMNEAEKKQMEKRLAGYLKEIDKCIALLGQ
ncbi:MAG: hypothetical protein EOO05_09530 [Chitinophagaceae bacterium]|nr:MAG: hypothetical protein EOO05_09530 [Chitinophagaceae bacterium]